MVRQEKCAIVSCSAVRNPSKGVSLHILPQDSISAERWMQFLSKANGVPPRESGKRLICSQHFLPTCVNSGPMGKPFIPVGHTPSILEGKEFAGYGCKSCLPQDNQEHGIELELSQLLQEDNVTVRLQNQEYEIKRLTKKVQDLEQELEQLEVLQNALSFAQKQIKSLKMLVYRRDLHNQDLKRKSEEIMESSKRIRLDAEVQTEYTFGQIPKGDLLFEMMGRKSHNQPYTDEQREFCFKMFFKSPAAYKDLRTGLNNSLPYPQNFSRWTISVDSSPGILKQSVMYVKESNVDGKRIYYCLAFDEVAMRRHLDLLKGKIVGYTDYGGIAEEEETKKEAKNALFCLATEINGKKSFPLGYILTHGLKATTMKEFIVACVDAVQANGGVVTNITFDGHRSNFKAAELLGANLNGKTPEFKPYFEMPEKNKIYIVPDASHMFKLLRNSWKKVGIIVDKNGNEIKWKYVNELHRIQSECGFRAANKLTVRHLNFEQQKMKTNLAVQLTSNSVATGIEVCRLLSIPEFEMSEATVNFLRIFDRIFDFLNSRTSGTGFKKPISLENAYYWKPFIETSKEYILSLKMRDEKGILISAFDHKLCTFAKGIYAAICCVEAIVDDHCRHDGDLRFLPAFNTGQDNLEIFFGKIRSRHGCNNNPSALQLRHTVRSLLCFNVGAPWTGNCVPQEEVMNKIAPTSCLRTLMSDGDEIPLESNLSDDDDPILPIPRSPESQAFVDTVITYIAGFVGRSVSSQLKCGKCISFLIPDNLEAMKSRADFVLINERDNGGLFYPSSHLIEICKTTERVISKLKQSGIPKLDASIITRETVKEFMEGELIGLLLHENMDAHSVEDTSEHVMNLVRSVSARYTRTRLKYICKEETLKLVPTSVRSSCNNLVQFKGN